MKPTNLNFTSEVLLPTLCLYFCLVEVVSCRVATWPRSCVAIGLHMATNKIPVLFPSWQHGNVSAWPQIKNLKIYIGVSKNNNIC